MSQIQTADSSLHGRPTRERADREVKHAAIPLGMTAQGHRRAEEGSRQAPLGQVYRGSVNRTAGWLLLAGIRFYQAVFAPVMPVGCKFYPSCSHYAAEAIAQHGAVRGAWLAAARLWRCRPFTKGGYDPVPDVDANMSDLFSSGRRDGSGSAARNEVGS